MAYTQWLDGTGTLLGPAFPLPLDQPFLGSVAVESGCSRRDLARLLAEGLLRRPLHGVYAAAQAPDSIAFRASALALVIPECAVVTDRAAGWLHGMRVLRRGAHLDPPPIEVCHTTDTRCRRGEADGHRRGLLRRDVTTVGGIRVTTPLRTALDLGRLTWRYDAIAALDAALRIGVDHDELLSEIGRFKGYRGVRQLRVLAPLADGRAESGPEGALRLHWHEACLPWPDAQIWIHDDNGIPIYRLDLGKREVRYAAEYDGIENHSEEEDVEHDRERRAWIRDERGWTIDVFGKDDVYGWNTDIQDRLRAGFFAARKNVTLWRP
jgi:hypothetical protein